MDNLTYKFFALEEANRIIPEVQDIVMDIIREKNELAMRLVEATRIKQAVTGDGSRGALQRKFDQIVYLQHSLTEGHKKLLEKGIIIRDIDQGIVDFPTIIQGDLGYFCWKMGEPRIGYWHAVGEGTRMPITNDLKIMHLHNVRGN